MKKIFALTLAILICFTMIGCNKNPSGSSQYSSEIIVEEVIVETVVSDTESNVESTPSENVVSNDSSQTQTSQPTPPEETKNVIPEGGTYTCTSKGIVLTAGQEWPESCEEYDIYTYGDYKYVYNVGIIISSDQDPNDSSNDITIYDNNIVGWVVGVLDKGKTAYGKILENVNEEPVVSMGMMETKDGVFTREGTFGGCAQLVVAPEIPKTVINMYESFFMCESLVKAPKIPNGVIHLRAAFALCKSLEKAPEIPSSVTNMRSAFGDCTSLTDTITINANPSQYDYCFSRVDMSKITLTGDATKETLNNIGSTGENYTPIP